MPKISGPNIAQHVANQEAAVFDAAIRLFAARGVDAVSMGSIAYEVGLARPSLYRYFPTKASILIRWFQRTMDPLVAESQAIAQSDADPDARFDAWIDRQVSFLLDDANRAMIRASLSVAGLSDEDRLVLQEGHRNLFASLQTIVADGSAAEDDAIVVRVLLIVDLLRRLDNLIDGGVSPERARAELLRASRLIAEIEPHPT